MHAQNIYKLDGKSRVSLSSGLRTANGSEDLELIVDPRKLGEEINIDAYLLESDKNKLAEILGESGKFTARVLGVIAPVIPVPIQDEREMVTAIFSRFELQKYAIKPDKDGRFVLPPIVDRNNLLALFQNLETINLRGEIIKMLAVATITNKEAG